MTKKPLGQAYYVNKYTKESQWEMPTRAAERSQESEKVFIISKRWLKLFDCHTFGIYRILLSLFSSFLHVEVGFELTT